MLVLCNLITLKIYSDNHSFSAFFIDTSSRLVEYKIRYLNVSFNFATNHLVHVVKPISVNHVVTKITDYVEKAALVSIAENTEIDIDKLIFEECLRN